MRAWLLIFVLLSVGGNVVLSLYWGGAFGDLSTSSAKLRSNGNSGSGLVVYDLPPVTTNYKDGTGTRVLKMRLGLELSGRDDIPAVQERLPDIINRVARDLERLDDSDLDSAEALNQLRQTLHEGVNSAAGDTFVEDVLFNEVIVF